MSVRSVSGGFAWMNAAIDVSDLAVVHSYGITIVFTFCSQIFNFRHIVHDFQRSFFFSLESLFVIVCTRATNEIQDDSSPPSMSEKEE